MRTVTQSKFVVEVLTDIDDVCALKRDWSELMDRALDDEPFLTPEWMLAWWDAFGSGALTCVSVRAEGALVGVGIFRITRERVWGRDRRVLRFLANAHSNRANVILDSHHAKAAAGAMVRALWSEVPEWDVARLGPVWQDGRATRAFTEALAAEGKRWGAREGFASPYAELPDSWDALLARVPGSYRSTVRRKERKARRSGVVSFSFVGDSPSDVESAFEISPRTWQHDAGTGLVSVPENRRFYRTLAEAAAERGWLRVAYLLVDGEPVSYEYNIEYKGVLYNLKLAYDAEHRSLSPGLLLKLEVLRRAIGEGLREYDFLGTAEGYKTRWTDKTRVVCELWLYRRGLVPRFAHLLYFRVRPALERAAPRLLALKRRLWRSG